MFPSVPALLVPLLQAQFPAVRVVTHLPIGLEQALPALQVTRFGGAGDVLTMDRAYIDVDVWAATLEEADTLASQVATWMRLHLPGKSATAPSGTGVFAKVAVQSGMSERPSGNPDVWRVGGAFTISVHGA